jgi:hypothetical protein
MTVEIHKKLAIQLFACARQAERSVAFAQLGPDQWALLRDYYRHEKREYVREVVSQLEQFIPSPAPLIDRNTFFKGTFVRLLRRPFIRLTNHSRLKWRFTHNEIIFIRQTLNCLVGMLPLQPVPPALTLFNLRMDCFTCKYIIDTHLHGTPELDVAVRVEHFCQSDYIAHAKIEELFEYEKTSGLKTDAKTAKGSASAPRNPTNRVA